MVRAPLVVVVLALVVALAGCGEAELSTRGEVVQDRPLRVVTTTNFITDTTKAIGGDRVEVDGLFGPGVDPHLFKASAGDVSTLRDADLVLYGGLDLEGKMEDVFEELGRQRDTVAISSAIPRAQLLREPSGVLDPHIWFDVSKWRQVAALIRDELGAKAPQLRSEFEARWRRYDAQLVALDDYARRRVQAIPRAQRVLVTSHDAFQYFGRAYGLEVASIQGISTAAEATTTDVKRVAGLIAARGLKTVFIESSVSRRTLDAVLAAARRQGQPARVGGELYADAAGDPGTEEGTYIGMVRANVDLIAEGLS